MSRLGGETGSVALLDVEGGVEEKTEGEADGAVIICRCCGRGGGGILFKSKIDQDMGNEIHEHD